MLQNDAIISRWIKVVAAVLAAALMAVPGAHASHKVRKAYPNAAAGIVADAAQRCRGANLFHCGPLYNSNDYLGNDPDPFVRLMIQRDLGIKYGGEE